MTYEKFCGECEQVYDEGMFPHNGRICVYCWSIKGLDHVFLNEEIKVFGEFRGAADSTVKFKGWWDK